MSAHIRTVILAAYVNPFLLFDNLSLFLFEFDSELTIDMWEIWTAAHPTLKSAGSVKYQAV